MPADRSPSPISRIRAPVARVRDADFFADVEHRRFVALALADDDGAVNRHRVHHLAHRFDGDEIGVVPVALAHRMGAGDGGLFDHPKKLQREI